MCNSPKYTVYLHRIHLNVLIWGVLTNSTIVDYLSHLLFLTINLITWLFQTKTVLSKCFCELVFLFLPVFVV